MSIREYDSKDEKAVQRLYWETAQQHRTRQIMASLAKRRNARRTWQAGLVGIVGLHLASSRGRAWLLLELAVWSAGVGVGWYMWVLGEWQQQVAQRSARMAVLLTEIKEGNAKNNAWVMEQGGGVVGAVGLAYEPEEREGRIRTLTGVESRIELALVRTVIQFARQQDIKVIAKSGDDAKWSECCFSVRS